MSGTGDRRKSMERRNIKNMKKSILLILISFMGINLYSQSHKYSKEFFADKILPLTAKTHEYIDFSYSEIDLLLYKTVIRNGDIQFLESRYLSDLQLGVLNKNELRVLRNMYFAKKGYIFSDEELTDYYKQFEWYKPTTKTITFTDLEERAINRIKKFENTSLTDLEYSNNSFKLREFTGGADQAGITFKMNKDGSFEYYGRENLSRLRKLCGTWQYKDKKLILYVQKETALLGGYIAADAIGYYLTDTKESEMTFDEDIRIELPVSKSEYKENYGIDCIDVGSLAYFLEE